MSLPVVNKDDSEVVLVQEVDDPEERKMARRLRIAHREMILGGYKESVSENSQDATGQYKIQNQLDKNEAVLGNYIAKAENDVKEYLICNYNDFNAGRMKRNKRLQDMLEDIEQNAQIEEKRFNQIMEKWLDIKKLRDPFKVYQRIENQRNEFRELLKTKDETIAKLKRELKAVSDEHNREFGLQKEEIASLNKTIDFQTKNITGVYKVRYEMIADVMKKVKSEELDERHNLWDVLYQEVQEKLLDFFNTKLNFKQNLSAKTEDYSVKLEEYMRQLKIRLANDVEVSRQALQEAKFKVARHCAALNYDGGVLNLRQDENAVRKGIHRRIMVNLQHQIAVLRKELQNYKNKIRKKFEDLEKDINRKKQNILVVERKSKRIMELSDHTFMKMWKLCTKESRDIVQKILGFNKTMNEQEMGISCTNEPNLSLLFDILTLPSYGVGAGIMEKTCLESLSLDPKRATIRKNNQPKQDDSFELKKQLEMQPEYLRLLKHILVTVSDKSGFLTEKRIREIIREYENEEKSLVRLDHVFWSFGINNGSDIDILVEYFQPYCFCLTCNQNTDMVSYSTISRSRSSMHSSVAIMRSMGVLSQRVSCLTEDISNINFGFGYNVLQEAVNTVIPTTKEIEDAVIDVATSESGRSININMNLFTDALDDTQMVISLVDDDTTVCRLKSAKSVRKSKAWQCVYSHNLVIMTCYILVALKTFVVGYHQLPERIPTIQERLNLRRRSVARLLEDQDIVDFWKHIKTFFDKKLPLWDNLYDGVSTYYRILIDRKSLSEEVIKLRIRNKRLKEKVLNYKNLMESNKPTCKGFYEQFIVTGLETRPLCM